MAAPALVRSGRNFIRSGDLSTVYLRGFCYSVPKSDPELLYTYLPSMFPGANLLKISMEWETIEPNRPLGGDPTTTPPTWATRDLTSSGNLAELETVLEWCDANGVYAIVSMQGTGGGQYFSPGSTQTGYPTWLFDDTQWAGGTDISNPAHRVAPMPHDRAGYGGAYLTSAVNDFSGAKWMSVAAGDPNYAVVGNKNWQGDWDTWMTYMEPVVAAVYAVASNHPSFVGFKWFNEPKTGGLTLNAMKAPLATLGITGVSAAYPAGNTSLAAIEQMHRSQSRAFAYWRTLDSVRFMCVSGIGGGNWTDSPDWSRLWTTGGAGGGAATCPSDHPYVLEPHWYSGGAAAPLDGNNGPSPPGPMDNPEGSSSGTSPYAPVYDGDGNPTYEFAHIDGWNAIATRISTPLLIGEWGKHNDVTGSDVFVADMANCYNRHNVNQAWFSLGGGAAFSPLVIAHGAVTGYSTVGAPIAEMLAVPYAESDLTPAVLSGSAAPATDHEGENASVTDTAGESL